MVRGNNPILPPRLLPVTKPAAYEATSPGEKLAFPQDLVVSRPPSPAASATHSYQKGMKHPETHKDKDVKTTDKKVLSLHSMASEYTVHITDGHLHNAKGLLDTRKEAKFVMLADGTLHAGVKFSLEVDGKKRSLHHSSFSHDPIAAAGLLVAKQGVLAYAISDSGHYQPTAIMMAQFLRELRDNGVQLAGLPVGYFEAKKPEKGDPVFWYDAAFAEANAATLAEGRHADKLDLQIPAPERLE